MNRDFIVRLRDTVLKNAEKFDMSDYCRSGTERTSDIDRAREILKTPDCGTVACLAGWAVVIASREEIDRAQEAILIQSDYDEEDVNDIETVASHLLGIESCRTIFYASVWPEQFRTENTEVEMRWGGTMDNAPAHMAAKRLDYLLETGN